MTEGDHETLEREHRYWRRCHDEQRCDDRSGKVVSSEPCEHSADAKNHKLVGWERDRHGTDVASIYRCGVCGRLFISRTKG